ncbi:MAG: DUF4411 family protein [Bacteroidetes bacterium]|nr:DUF4411 family protein [Bacteroidota bacterium]
MGNERFIIDTDTLIAPYRSFYPFDMVPDFWSFIEQNILSKKIMILDKVYNEITDGGDQLSNWLADIKNIEMINCRNSTIISHYAKILDYINISPLYRKPEALFDWASDKTADAWLIAAAITYSCTVITFEISNASLNDKQPTRDVKIPDICKQFNVKCENLYYMMRHLGFKRK